MPRFCYLLTSYIIFVLKFSSMKEWWNWEVWGRYGRSVNPISTRGWGKLCPHHVSTRHPRLSGNPPIPGLYFFYFSADFQANLSWYQLKSCENVAKNRGISVIFSMKGLKEYQLGRRAIWYKQYQDRRKVCKFGGGGG